MKKPPLRLALSVTVVLLQASLLQASAAPPPSIWQTLSGASSDGQGAVAGNKVAKKAPHVVHATTAAKKASAPAAHLTAQGVASSGMNGQVVLFLGKSKDAGAQGVAAPAAALTIHTSLPENGAPEVAAEPATTEQPTLVAMNPTTEKVVSDAASPMVQQAGNSPLASNKQLLAQLAPDQLVAQASSDTAVTPIPPVVSGTVDLEEFKPTNAIDLRVSQSRTFKLRNKIIRTSISDPSIAEPVVVAENQMVLLGKAPGTATLVIWDDAGNSVAVDVRVQHDYTTLQSMLREIDPRIIVRPFAIAGTDRVILTGDVDHPESIIRAFAVANAFMDDRGINITVANNRILNARIGEQGGQAGGGGGGGQLSNIGNVDRYSFFGNQLNNITKAQTMLSDGGRVTSLVRVRKAPLIVLHCTFLEMNSSAAREVGAQLGLNFTNQNFAFAVGGNNGVSSNTGTLSLQSYGGANGHIGQITGNPSSVLPTGFLGLTGVSITPASAGTPGKITTLTTPSLLGQGALNGPLGLLSLSNLFGIPGGSSFNSSGLGNLFTAVSTLTNKANNTSFSVNPTLQALVSHNRARVLAEPTVVTESGERAAFLVGGEIPILQSIAAAGTAAQSVTFEPFGLRLNVIPVLQENGSINLQLAPEERLISTALGNNVLGQGTSPIPGFVTRRFQTTVEMRPGQELFIAGLVSANHGREVDKIPVLGEIPVLGALYRSKAFSKNESELVVAVRPEIILPGTPGQLKLPEEISKVEGPRDTNFFQVEPTVIDERYMRTGRAEKTLQLPGVLPPDAPVPDNK